MKKISSLAVMALLIFCFQIRGVSAEDSKTETLVIVKDTLITKKQFVTIRKNSDIRKSIKKAPKAKNGKNCKTRKAKKIAATSDWILYASPDRDFSTMVRYPQDENTPLTIQTETITFPDGHMAHYTCHCENAEPGEDVCQFNNKPNGEPDLNSCGGAECCGITVHVMDPNGTPIAKFPG